MKTPLVLAEELHRLREERDRLDVRIASLREEFLHECLKQNLFEVGPLKITPTTLTEWKTSMVPFLIEHGYSQALRPITAEIDKLYLGGELLLSEIVPHRRSSKIVYKIVKIIDDERPA